MKKSWLRTCLLNFLIASLLGLMLRFQYLLPFHFEYRYVVHAHSHAALLGWAYLMIFGFAVDALPHLEQKRFQVLFRLTQLSVIGMMATFPFTGYALLSIVFSTLHIFCSYAFFFMIRRHFADRSFRSLMMRTALGFMILSTAGVWALGFLDDRNPLMFNAAIQFFLHFQFNGWFTFAVLGLACSELFSGWSGRTLKTFYFLLLSATILTFAMPLYGIFRHPVLEVVNMFGSALQLAAIGLLLYRFLTTKSVRGSGRWVLYLAVGSLATKTVFQVLTVFPELLAASGRIRELSVGFIHLVMLGMITGFVMYFVISQKSQLIVPRYWHAGTAILFSGFLVTEFLIFLQGAYYLSGQGYIHGYVQMLSAASVLFPIGILLCLRSIR